MFFCINNILLAILKQGKALYKSGLHKQIYTIYTIYTMARLGAIIHLSLYLLYQNQNNLPVLVMYLCTESNISELCTNASLFP